MIYKHYYYSNGYVFKTKVVRPRSESELFEAFQEKLKKGQKIKMHIFDSYGGLNDSFQKAYEHWNFPERKDTDIVMEKNADGVYERVIDCPFCWAESKQREEK